MSAELKARLDRLSGSHVVEIDMAVVERLAALPEHAILAYFWLMHRKGAERLPLLLQLSKVVVDRPADWDRRAVRLAHEQWVKQRLIVIDSTMCFACGDSHNRHYFHHILEVQNGGSNAGQNLVPLCFLCHQYLHPWLTEEPAPARVNDFESLYDIMTKRRLIRLSE